MFFVGVQPGMMSINWQCWVLEVQVGQRHSHNNVRLQVRRVLFTPEFQAKHGTLVQLLSVATTWPGSRWTLAVEPRRANLALTTNSAWRRSHPDMVVAAEVLLDSIAEVGVEATGGTMRGRLLLSSVQGA